MGGVVAADLTCEYQRRQQDLVYTEADDQHLKASSFTIFTPSCLGHILLPALPIRPVTEPLESKSKACRSQARSGEPGRSARRRTPWVWRRHTDHGGTSRPSSRRR